MTTKSNDPHNQRRPPGGGRPVRLVPDVAGELRRLMPRDRWLLDLLHHHQMFSTEQIAALAFDNVRTARNRLNQLGQRGVLARFRDCVRPGSQSWRWTLGWVGAADIAGELAHPDGHGVWTENGCTVGFWVEYDTGSEPARRVLDKLDGYAALHRATGLRHAVLIRMQTARQEATLHPRLRTHPAVTRGGLVVATMSGDHTDNRAA